MAYLRYIKYKVGKHEIYFKVPPLGRLDLEGNDSQGYVTGISGTSSLPKNVTTSPKAFGGSHFHGINVLDREVVVTFKPIGSPSSVRAKINSISTFSKTANGLGRLTFGLMSENAPTKIYEFGNDAAISDFEVNLFSDSTEFKITFKMPDPYFIEKPVYGTARNLMSFSISNGELSVHRNIHDEGAPESGEVLYEIDIYMPSVKRGDTLEIRGVDDSEVFSVKFTEDIAKEVRVRFGVPAVGQKKFVGVRNFPYGSTLTSGLIPKIYTTQPVGTEELFLTVKGSAKISKATTTMKALVLEGF